MGACLYFQMGGNGCLPLIHQWDGVGACPRIVREVERANPYVEHGGWGPPERHTLPWHSGLPLILDGRFNRIPVTV